MTMVKIIGQDQALRQLKEELWDKKQTGSYLFEGPRSIGKCTTALWISSVLFCQQGTGSPCGDCSSCKRLSRLAHPDLIYLAPEKGVINIERVREAMHQLQYPPLETSRRILLIDEADLLNSFSANALLKTLEEPPAQAIIILVTANSNHLLTTILSRLKRIRFAPLSDKLRSQLLNVSPAQAKLLQVMGFQNWQERAQMENMLDQLSNDQKVLMQLVSESWSTPAMAPGVWRLGAFLLEDEEAVERRCILLMHLLRDLYYVKNQIDPQLLTFSDQGKELQNLAKPIRDQALASLLDYSQRIINGITHQHANRKIAVEAMLSAMEHIAIH
jgi:DNA polymerase III delta' subunit